ncbi:MAG: 4-alpha-glucanotransferase, partial [Erysipelothrix sp.]|nr:4-alpha-glucanotransferase [Erysipelothrix sp.]
PLQDIMGIDNSGRINTPATIGSPNWEWKIENTQGLPEAMAQYREWNKKTNRI